MTLTLQLYHKITFVSSLLSLSQIVQEVGGRNAWTQLLNDTNGKSPHD